MPLEDDDKSVDDAGEAAFAAAFSDEKPDQPAAKEKPEPATDTAREKADPAPEYENLTKEEVAALRAAVAEGASLKQQLAKVNGNIGNLYKTINELQASKKAELSTTAYKKLQDQFPELADMTKEAVENYLRGQSETDTVKIEDLVAKRVKQIATENEIEALEDAHSDWKVIVGAVEPGQKPDPENPFRVWLATKDATYQARVNGTVSAAVLTRAISLFQNETRQAPKPQTSARDNARRELLRDNVRPHGDGAPPTSGKSSDDAFLSGFNS